MIVPEPVPDRPPVTASQDSSGTAVHSHEAWVVTVAVSVPAAMHGAKSTGVTRYSHAGAGAVSPS